MKLRFRSILCTVAIMASMISCTKEENWRESNLPPTVALTDVLSSDGARVRPNYVFTVEIGTAGATKTESGTVLEAKFVSNRASLHQGAYTAAKSGSEGHGNFIIGDNGSKLYVDGQEKAIAAGTIDVKVTGATYTISGAIKLDDNTWFDFACEDCALSWGELPEKVNLVEVTSAQSNVASGTMSVTVNLSDGNWKEEMNWETWQSTVTGSGYYFAIDFYSEDGYLAPGTYKASQVGGTINPGEFGIGWDPGDLWGIGQVFTDWGTCWWTVDANAEIQKVAKKITSGEIVVELAKDKTYTIYMDNDELVAEFVGKIPALTQPDKPAGGDGGGDSTTYTELTNLISATKNTGLLTINMAQEGLTATTDPNTWQTVWSGNGNYLALDIYSADGKLYTGEYTACETGGVVGEGQFGIGYDTEFWGMQMYNWGTCWWTVANGATSAEKILDGTIKVSVKGDNLVITLKSSVANARFTYPIANFVDGQGAAIEVVNLGGDEEEEEGGDTGNYVALRKLLSFQSNVQSGTKSVTINMAQEGLSSTTDPNTWQTTWTGEGCYLALDAYSSDGTLAPGTYTACATGGVIGEGEFGIGWDPGDLWGIGMVFENWGTCWWTVANGVATAEKVTDGTLTVEADGDIYTITLQSSLVNAQYVGKLTVE